MCCMERPEVEVRFPPKLDFLLEKRARYKVMYGGRGAAKSWGVARALLIEGYKRPVRVLCAREIQRTISDSVHRLLADQIEHMGLHSFYRITDAEIVGLNGSSFTFAGLRQQDIGKIKSFEGVDICWCEEAQTISKKSWDILIPTIRKEGSEIWVTFNPELDTDETYTRFVITPPPGALVVKVNYSDNDWFPETLDKERLHLKAVDPEAYENVWEGKCRVAVEGAIYAKEVMAMIEGKRFRPVPYDPLLKVHTIWDLGWNDQTSIIFAQRLGGELRIVDYYEKSHTTYADDVKMLESKPYRYGMDYLPHDAKAETKAADGKSPEEILRSLGRRTEIVRLHDVEVGIKAARVMFPRVYMDSDKALRLMDCLKRYRRRINQTTNEPESPLHDEYSHGADAFRGLAMVVDQLKNDIGDAKKIKYPPLGIV